jgi:phage-related protein
MSGSTYDNDRPVEDKELVWLHGEVKTPPFSAEARRSAGFLLRLIQQGLILSMPHSRSMPVIGRRCHELRVSDSQRHVTWRIIYRVDGDAVVIGRVFAKKTQNTPQHEIDACKRRYRLYDRSTG